MTTNTLPSTNGLISDATARKVIGNIFAWVSLAISATLIVNGFLQIPELRDALVTVAGITAGLYGLFQLTSTSPNVPTPAALAKASAGIPSAAE